MMKGMNKLSTVTAMAAAALCINTAWAALQWNVRTNITEDVDENVSIAITGDAVVLQSGYSVNITTNPPPAGSDASFGNGPYNAAYLLEGGDLKISADGWYLYGNYHQFRQTGGDFSAKRLYYRSSPMRADLVFGGSGSADLGYNDYLNLLGDATFAVQDSVSLGISVNAYKYIGLGTTNHYVFAYNGGVAEFNFGSAATNIFSAFNGGTRAFWGTSEPYRMFGYEPKIRIYENGGGIFLTRGSQEINGFDMRAPSGNVVKSITLTPEAIDNNGAGWDFPPQVEITDSTGANAAAIVDYDYETRTVTNITVLCGGENYTAPTAQFRMYDRGTGAAKDLLASPLTCVIGTTTAGQFTFSTTNENSRIDFQTATNNCGSLVIDMDKDGLVDHGKSSVTGTDANYINTVVVWSGDRWERTPFFHNCTKLIIKSGCLCIPSGFGYNSKSTKPFPKCFNIEFYGGHLSGGSFLATNVVVGGETWLTGHYKERNLAEYTSSPYWIDFRVMTVDGKAYSWATKTPPTTPGTMTVDVDSPYGRAALKYGTVRFGGTAENPSKIHLKNYESLKRSKRRRVLLDLSETRHMDSSSNVTIPGTFGTPVPVLPDDLVGYGRLKWDDTKKKLYWQPSGGMYLIFR